MRTEKVSLSLDKGLVAEAREIVGSRELSSYVNQALRLQLQHDRIAGLLGELEQEFGPVASQVTEEVHQAWPLPDDEPTKHRDS